MSDLNITVNSIPMTYEKKKERAKKRQSEDCTLCQSNTILPFK